MITIKPTPLILAAENDMGNLPPADLIQELVTVAKFVPECPPESVVVSPRGDGDIVADLASLLARKLADFEFQSDELELSWTDRIFGIAGPHQLKYVGGSWRWVSDSNALKHYFGIRVVPGSDCPTSWNDYLSAQGLFVTLTVRA